MSCDPLTLDIADPGISSRAAGSFTRMIESNLELIRVESSQSMAAIDFECVAQIAQTLHQANRIFISGAGRSGLVMRMFAMRLMHLGCIVHIVGDTTTPAIGETDILLAASGSGSTRSTISAARSAGEAGAQVLSLTTNLHSELALLSRLALELPAAQKTDHRSSLSKQFSGSLFEQMLFLLSETLFQSLWQMSGKSPEDLYRLHANLE